MQIVTKIVFDEKLSFFKDLFNTGMGMVEPAVRTVYGSPYRWGSEGGFGGVRTSRYQYVQGKKVFSREVRQ